jgi:hypothetical protein
MSSKQFTRQIFAWLAQIKDDRGLPASAALVVIDFFNEAEGGVAWASEKTIADGIGMSVGTVHTVIHKLGERGHLKIEWGKPGRGHSNHYWMRIKDQQAELFEPVKAQFEGGQKAQSDDVKAQFTDLKAQPTEQNLSYNHSKNHRRDKTRSPDDASLGKKRVAAEGTSGEYSNFNEAEALKLLKSVAHTERTCRDHGWPAGNDGGVKINSGENHTEAKLPDRVKTIYERAWLKLSPEEQELLRWWREQNLKPKNAGTCEPFERFWRVYPKRKAKDAARKAFTAAVKRGADPEVINAAAQRYAIERQGQPQRWTKHPATWLNGGCWEDEPDGAVVVDELGNVVAIEQEEEDGEDDFDTSFREFERAVGYKEDGSW